MSHLKTFRRVWIQISPDYFAGSYPAFALLPPKEYCTDPLKHILVPQEEGRSIKMDDTDVQNELISKIKQSNDTTDPTFLQKVQFLMLGAITVYNSELALKASYSHKPAALWLRYEGPSSAQTTAVNDKFRTQCKSSDETSHLADTLDEEVCEILQYFVFKRMHSVKPIFALGPTPNEVLYEDGGASKLAKLDSHFHDQRDKSIWELRGGPPVPPPSSQMM